MPAATSDRRWFEASEGGRLLLSHLRAVKRSDLFRHLNYARSVHEVVAPLMHTLNERPFEIRSQRQPLALHHIRTFIAVTGEQVFAPLRMVPGEAGVLGGTAVENCPIGPSCGVYALAWLSAHHQTQAIRYARVVSLVEQPPLGPFDFFIEEILQLQFHFKVCVPHDEVVLQQQVQLAAVFFDYVPCILRANQHHALPSIVVGQRTLYAQIVIAVAQYQVTKHVGLTGELALIFVQARNLTSPCQRHVARSFTRPQKGHFRIDEGNVGRRREVIPSPSPTKPTVKNQVLTQFDFDTIRLRFCRIEAGEDIFLRLYFADFNGVVELFGKRTDSEAIRFTKIPLPTQIQVRLCRWR